MSKILRAVSEKKPKNPLKIARFRNFPENRNFFGQTAGYVSSSHYIEHLCKKSKNVFEKNCGLTNYYYYRGDFMGPGDRVAGTKSGNREIGMRKSEIRKRSKIKVLCTMMNNRLTDYCKDNNKKKKKKKWYLFLQKINKKGTDQT